MRVERRTFLKMSIGTIGLALFDAKKALATFQTYGLDRFKDVYYPWHADFQRIRQTFNSAIKKKAPDAIIQSKNTKDFSEILKLSTLKGFKIRMRSGGHSYAGFSTGEGIVLDVRAQKGFRVSKDGQSVTIGSGLLLKEAVEKFDEHGLSFPAGEYPTVGVAGYLLGGGHSRRSRFLGIGADFVLAMNVVLADGQRVEVSPTNYSDLYWALLGGGGGNFALVESFKLKAHRSFNDYFFKFIFRGDEAEDLFDFWQRGIAQDPDHYSVNLTTYVQDGRISKLIISGLVMDVSNDLEAVREEFKSSYWAALEHRNYRKFKDQIQSSNRIKQNGKGTLAYKGSSHYADEPLTREGIKDLYDSIKKRTKGTFMYLGFYPKGGKVKRPEFDISYPHRDALYILDMFSEYREKDNFDLFKNNFDSLHRDLNPLFSGRSYVNYPDLSFGEDWARRYYGDNLEKLLEVKKKYDPEHRFNFGKHSLSSYLLQ